jgi:hypothetical protein
MPVIRIHRDGRWTADGAPVRHEKIFRLFHESLERLPGGSYRIVVNGQECPVEVEDLPFIVRRVRWEWTESGEEVFHLLLNTDDEEPLDPAGLRGDTGGGLVCHVRGGRFEARFTRDAIGHLAPYLEIAPDGNAFLVTETQRFPIPQK